MNTHYQMLVQGCEQEKLHLSGAIQSYGALLTIDMRTLLVTHASSNLENFVDVSASDVIGMHVDKLSFIAKNYPFNFPQKTGETYFISNVMQNKMSGKCVDALFIRHDTTVLVELENNDSKKLASMSLYHHRLMQVPYDDIDLTEYNRNLVNYIQAITGYDRVMLYSFREDWTGEVLAEAKLLGLGSYLGLRFPGSDIPSIARDIYMLNPYRMISDVNCESIGMVGKDNESPDLTMASLRSVSPLHIAYLKNMGVTASFSVPIKVHSKLWGLLACHHLASRVLTREERNACVEVCNIYSLNLSSYFAGKRLKLIDSIKRQHTKLLDSIAAHSDPLDGIVANGQALIEMLKARSFAMAIDKEFMVVGEGPPLSSVEEVDNWFLNDYRSESFYCSQLTELVPNYFSIHSTVSGMVALKAFSTRSGWVRAYWFREAEVQEVAWAGSQDKPKNEDAGAAMLSPRRSFERWVETKLDCSREWSLDEKLIASHFRAYLSQWL